VKSVKILVPSALFILLPFGCLAQANPSSNDLVQLRQQVAAQQKQLDEQRRALEAAQAALDAQQKKLDSLSPAPGAAAGATAPAAVSAKVAPAPPAADADNSPFSFRIGGAEFAPGGFMDFSTAWRSTNIGSGVATSFAGVPMGNTAAGRMQEFRSSAANSRISLTVTEHPTKNVFLTGYLEADFYGNQPASLFVTSNSNTLRMRHFWVNAQRGKWEVLGGQTWTLLTPNRVGTSQVSSNVFVGMGEDSNYMPGLAWARPGQIRVTYHPNAHWSVAAAVENPQQYVTAGTTLPAFAAGQVDNGGVPNAPNVRPDLVAKLAYDTRISGKALHLEVAGFSRQFRISPANGSYFGKQAVGGTTAVVAQVTRNLRLIATGMYGSGGGRILTGLGPDFVVGPDGSISPVHSMGGTAGFEYTVDANSQIFGYYGGTYFNRNYTATGPGSYVGFGYPGSNSANRQFQEPSFGYYYTFWKSPKYGSLQAITEYAYLTRTPWSVPAGTPSTAHAHMVFGSIRFTLPQGTPREPAPAR
jgi:hypothetical protein